MRMAPSSLIVSPFNMGISNHRTSPWRVEFT
jgi:hypothetical protein